jgi:Zn-dependent protease with chaperone function
MRHFLLQLAAACLTFAAMSPAHAQTKEAFTPSAVNTSTLSTLSGKFEKQYKQLVKDLPPENKKDYEKLYEQRWEHIQSKFKDKEIFTLPAAQRYLDSLLEAIMAGNPVLKGRQISCYFSRSASPNASYIGQGIILFNMGLFSKLDNESQAAFVLCHELAHYYLEHSEKKMTKYVTDMSSKALQTELRQIRKIRYNKLGKLEALQQGLVFDTRRHSRDHEAEADSLGLEFLRNTGFDLQQALTALAMLDKIDEDSLDMGACLRKMFDTKNYPFKDRWLARQEGLLGGHANLERDRELEDSMKTHPDCQARIRLLEPAVKEYTQNRTPENRPEAQFGTLKKLFRYEIIEYAYEAGNYTASLYYTIVLLQQNPDDPYLVTQVGKILNGCYSAQKQHKLGTKIKLPSPAYGDGYNMLLQFIENLYLEEYAELGFHYLNQFAAQFGSYPAFKSESAKSSTFSKS